jgi:regulator of cell morphogenesis and NO signaling
MTIHITADTRISDIAATAPATIKIFQQHQIDFCCGGKIPLAEACARRGIDTDTLLTELRAAQRPPEGWPDWEMSTLTALITHIQKRYHEPLRAELPRLDAMLAKVVQRHGDRLPETLLPLQFTFEHLQTELLLHMSKEDSVLFPAIVAAEAAVCDSQERTGAWGWIEEPLDAMVTEHESAGSALATMRALTRGYVPPEDACPTFRGLYHGLAEVESDMHLHVHLENSVLFPRAARLVQGVTD